MDIRVLQYFLAVAREESITKAAESLHMTQPPLSRQLRDLEEELGKTLLIRGGKKVTLTEDGMLLRKRAEEMIDLMEKTRAELASSDDFFQQPAARTIILTGKSISAAGKQMPFLCLLRLLRNYKGSTPSSTTIFTAVMLRW